MPAARISRETGAVAGHRVARAIDDGECARRLVRVAEVAQRHTALLRQPAFLLVAGFEHAYDVAAARRARKARA